MAQQMVRSIVAEAPSQVTVVWRSGKHTKVDLAEYLDSPGYEKLRDRRSGRSVSDGMRLGVEIAEDKRKSLDFSRLLSFNHIRLDI